MITIKAFKGLRPKESLVERIAAPPYDVLSSQEAKTMAAENPVSFLHINKPEIDLPEDVDPYSNVVYEKGRENLVGFIENGTLIQDEKECIYIYRLTWKDHVQTGYFCLSSVDDYDNGRIKKHELTRPAKEMDRTRLIDVMNAQVGPVFLLYPSTSKLDHLLEEGAKRPANVDFTADDGVRHQLWVIPEADFINRVVQGFQSLDATYIADGHHRSAAASRVCALRRKAQPLYTGKEAFTFFLSVIFPHNQLKVLPYNRVIKDLNGLTAQAFLQKLNDAFTVEPRAAAREKVQEHTFDLYLDNQWYTLKAKPGTFNADDPLDQLDVNILMQNILTPILNIKDPRTDHRIDFIGGIRGTDELQKLVDNQEWRCAFSLHPTSVEALLKIADAGKIMPPKSTWFEPKLRSGMVSQLL
ncbi:DUF1015 family protein [candidate division KSB1 bacterium]|nr:DUF1015 family protein [candidate division KSB1 bacterium]